MPIVIKRKISLDFLGEEYKEAYITFKAIPVKDFSELMQRMPKDGQEDNVKSMELMLEMLEKYFYEGKFPNDKGDLEPLSKEDVKDLDQQASLKCFQMLVGQDTDPKE